MCSESTIPDTKQFSKDDLVLPVLPPDGPGLPAEAEGSSTLGATSEYDQVRNALRYGDETYSRWGFYHTARSHTLG